MPMLVQPKKPLPFLYCIYSALVFDQFLWLQHILETYPTCGYNRNCIWSSFISQAPASEYKFKLYVWARIAWPRKQHRLYSLKWNTRAETVQNVAVWTADLINCEEAHGRTEDPETGCFSFPYCWLFCGLPCLRLTLLYWEGTCRVASAACAIWEQSITDADGQLLTGISLVGGWLQGWHQQVKSSLV